MTRYYDGGNGLVDCVPEHPERCIARLVSGKAGQRFQCFKKRGHGPYGELCVRHHNRLLSGLPVDIPGTFTPDAEAEDEKEG